MDLSDEHLCYFLYLGLPQFLANFYRRLVFIFWWSSWIKALIKGDVSFVLEGFRHDRWVILGWRGHLGIGPFFQNWISSFPTDELTLWNAKPTIKN